MALPNNYPGNCAVCKVLVEAQQGTCVKVRDRWLVYCPEHSGKPQQSEPPAKKENP